ncbi:MAG: alpha amylase C-terminal domain-containing protein, partial [Lachnospiraceae bacterium]|nr:alpha amylase C-terminal domain-containing protein [Lachnospiraceae bacterium]
FQWMSCEDADHSIVSFVRRGDKEDQMLLFVYNFTPVIYEGFAQPVPKAGKYKEVLNSDAVKFGGEGHINHRVKTAKKKPVDGQPYRIEITLPPLGVSVFEYTPEVKKK